MDDPKRSARTFGIAAIDAAGRQMNRRVEIVISDERGRTARVAARRASRSGADRAASTS